MEEEFVVHPEYPHLTFSKTNEMWKDILGWESYYQNSTFGRVKSLPRTFMRKNGVIQTIREKIMKPQKYDSYGHQYVTLHRYDYTLDRTIHSLVLETFVEPRSDGMECRHLNGKAFDNHVWNLAWGTSKENSKDRSLHGTSNKGKHLWGKLTDKQALEICYLYATGSYTRKQLAVLYNVSESTIGDLVTRKSYKHLDVPRIDQEKKKLTDQEVIQIYNLYSTGEYSQEEIGAKYGIHQTYVGDIVNGRTRKYLNLAPIIL